jgi:hypothetical protein
MYATGGRCVEPLQDAVQMLNPILFSAPAQFLAQFLGALRAGKKSFEQGAKIESGAAADDGQMTPRLALARRIFTVSHVAENYLLENLPRLACIFSRTDVGERIDAIEQMMGNFGALGRARLGRADFKFAVHRDRIAIYDFTAKAPRNRQGQGRLPARRGPEHDYEQRFAVEVL